MRLKHSNPGPSADVVAEASAWFVDFRVGDMDAARQEEFNRWVRRSPQHIEAYLEIAGTWADLPAARPADVLDVEALAAAARAQNNVVALNIESKDVRAEPRHTAQLTGRRGRAVRWLAVASVLIAVAAGLFTWFDQATAYSTGVGEQRFLSLPDGSTMELNAHSRVRIHFSDARRVVELAEGQALFRVVKDPLRPFIVTSGQMQVRAVGTEFDVYKKSSGTVITVVEGRVAATREPSGGGEVLLSAGEQLTLKPHSVSRPKPADPAAATAWTQRRLVFDTSQLSEVAEEFNRYNKKPLRVEGEAARVIRISGIYSSTDPASLLNFLRIQPGVAVIEDAHEIRVSAR